MNLNVQRTSKAALACLLSLLLVASFTLMPALSYAETSRDVQAQANDLQAQADALSARVDELSSQLAAAHEVESAAKAKYDAAEKAKADALARKAAAEAKIKQTQERLGERVKSIYRNGGVVSFLDVLLGAGSFEHFLTAYDAVEAINNQDNQLIEENRVARSEAEAAAKEFEAQSKVAKEALDEATKAREEIEAVTNQLAGELAAMNEEVAMLIAKAEEMRTEEQAKAAELEALRLQQQYGGNGDNGAGGTNAGGSGMGGYWVIPVSYSYVSCEFGYSPITGSHNGIDLAASYGTPIYAGSSGTVTYVGWYGTGGNSVIINHGGGVQTIYMHQSQTAAYVGQYVSAGECIGYVGSTGLSTGPHLHYQLVINGVPTNPRNYFNF